MRKTPDGVVLSATDLANGASCAYLTGLDLAVAEGLMSRPFRRDPMADLLRERGLEHENAYLDSLRAMGLDVVDLRAESDRVSATRRAIHEGRDVIAQGELRQGRWMGLPDVLLKVARPGRLPWSYEAVDTKLAQETRAGALLQLGLYSDLLATTQGVAPEFFHVVTPLTLPGRETHRAADFAAYARLVRRRLEAAAAASSSVITTSTYPEPVENCEVCAFFAVCDRRRRDDDHLSLIAGASRSQRRELSRHGITTMSGLASRDTLGFKPRRGGQEPLLRVLQQARLQVISSGLPVPRHELRTPMEGQGLARLPEPDPGDIFLDLEGDPFATEGGREYLFGAVTVEGGRPEYRAWWAVTHAQEREAFEAVIDFIEERRTRYPGLHIYHYAPYEPSAFKRLSGRHVSRQEALGDLLRGHYFVDLYAVVRQGLIAGVERYSIKNLEALYGFRRAVPLEDARFGLRAMERSLETGDAEIPEEVRHVVEGYNRDDCVSTARLRDWLESVRAEAVKSGTVLPRYVPEPSKASDKASARSRRAEDLRARLLVGVPDDPSARSDEEQARWLLAHMVDWHRREDNAAWWEYFRLRDLPDEELLDERQAVAGLEFVERLPPKGAGRAGVVDRYRYPAQEMEMRPGDELKTRDGKFGTIDATMREERLIDVAKTGAQRELHPPSAFAYSYINPAPMEKSLDRLADAILASGGRLGDEPGALAAARSLLLRARPQLVDGAFGPRPDETTVDFAVRAVRSMKGGVLAIQGPPGAGKTFAGARMILDLVARGRRVGVTSNSHKVILNLLSAVVEEAPAPPTLAHLPSSRGEASEPPPGIAWVQDNEAAREAIASGSVSVLGGTAWMWAREEFKDAIDVLFVDEAGQMSLANVVAASQAARVVVLLGDPQQLDQPVKGAHPAGLEVSALGHVLGDARTIEADRGIFLPETWRLPPALSAFTSELFYDDRLRSRPGLEAQRLSGTGDLGLDGNGLYLCAVAHDGNRSASNEEVDAVERLVRRLLSGGVRWNDARHGEAALSAGHVLVIAPYNAQVSRLEDALRPLGVKVGTVDKFQGQEAPVVIYSMAASSAEEAPRGMEFLYSLNRLNVATSRSKAAAILVASPQIFEPECRTPRQMKLANALCRFREQAREIALPGAD